MNLFISDLDKTLIYSKRFLEKYNEKEQIIITETKEGKEITFTSQKTNELIKKLMKKVVFIPVTTRSKEEYYRIHWVRSINPKYAIICNGGKIIVNGEEDKHWNRVIQGKFNRLPCKYESIPDIVNKHLKNEKFKRITFYDNLIWIYVFSQNPLDEEKESIKKIKCDLAGTSWVLYVVERKMYILPEFLTKWNAISYLNERYLQIKNIFASGDSLMDYEMLQNSTNGFTFSHGELKHVKDKNIYISQNYGLYGTEECLEKLLSLLKKQNHLTSTKDEGVDKSE